MLGTLLRWAVRLLFLALIAAAAGFAITRLLGGDDEDFDDFDDLESSFEFNETPVEIDVSGPAATEVSSADSDISSDIDSAIDSGDDADTDASSADTMLLDEQTAGDSEDSEPSNSLGASANGASGDSRLIDIKGIGPGYESRLNAIGIHTMSDLVHADADQVAEQAGVIGGAHTVEEWKERARAMESQGQE